MQLNTVHLGDCTELMKKMPAQSVDFIWTDPPYLVNYKDRSGRSIKNDVNDEWLKPAFKEAYRVLKNNSLAVSCYGWTKTEKFIEAWEAAGFRRVSHIVFPKRYASTARFMRYSHECAFLLAKGQPETPEYPIGDVIDWVYSGNKLHPTQKPLNIIEPCIDSFCPRGGVVLDPFAGSGSTLLAARNRGRQFIGFELDPEYHSKATQRLKSHSTYMMAHLLRERVQPEAQPHHAQHAHHAQHEAASAFEAGFWGEAA